MLRTGRLLAQAVRTCTLTPQERANLYVVADADRGDHGSLGGHRPTVVIPVIFRADPAANFSVADSENR